MKIKSIINVITNSSSETFITKNIPTGEHDGYEQLTWKLIVNPDYPFEHDLLVYLAQNFGNEEELKNNPFKKTVYESRPWENAFLKMDPDEHLKLWQKFVNENEASFREIVGFCYVYGLEEDDCLSKDSWKSINDNLRNQSIMYAPKNCDFNLE